LGSTTRYHPSSHGPLFLTVCVLCSASVSVSSIQLASSFLCVALSPHFHCHCIFFYRSFFFGRPSLSYPQLFPLTGSTVRASEDSRGRARRPFSLRAFSHKPKPSIPIPNPHLYDLIDHPSTDPDLISHYLLPTPPFFYTVIIYLVSSLFFLLHSTVKTRSLSSLSHC
jgi:hypothetical protein